MPPRTKITKDMILNAAYEIVRENGESSLNARTIAQRLNCSTQPVLYCFGTMDEIREEVYKMADERHTEYLLQMHGSHSPMGEIWRNYIRFGSEEKHLFRFLFQSNAFSGRMQSLFDDERLMPIYMGISEQTKIDLVHVKKLFAAVFYPIHGIASLLANNTMEYHEEEYEEVIHTIITGVRKGWEKNQ